ncbi:TVP38/TMEM64 family protein [Clostridium brassicae]|uniref:TVP38/TMEM64 family membrane protein n=1 Tax=Clostridium brassicae TaxID=2999072 RepID=A0ABT4DAE1_9CLOT|nr:TVP38/TMEM64 family protein [Clostridium brassicae]MCY6958096.1 TVP38/TMEM64 family protein [Clostridium brassicae]
MRNKKLVGLIIILLVTIFIFINREKLQEFKDVNSLVKYIKGYGKYALLCFIIIFSLKPILLVIPSAMLSIASGILFGPIKGFTINMVGFFISGTLAFMVARFLGKEFVDKILKGKVLSLNQNIEKKGFKILFLLRLPPVLPYDPLSYACGLTKIDYKAFIFASLLGVVPETLCYSYMGENIFNPLCAKFIIPMTIIVIATLLSGIAFKKSKDIV